MRKRLARYTLFLVIPLLCIAFWLAGLFWFVRTAHDMAPPKNAQAVDAVIVLTGGTRRLETGFKLLNDKKAPRLFISGVYRGTEVQELFRHVNKDAATNFECCIFLGEAENTIENAAETHAWMQKHGYKTAYLVTSNYHMKRALLEFAHAGKSHDITPWPVTPKRLDTKNWWRDPDFRVLMIREYVKYLLASMWHVFF